MTSRNSDATDMYLMGLTIFVPLTFTIVLLSAQNPDHFLLAREDWVLENVIGMNSMFQSLEKSIGREGAALFCSIYANVIIVGALSCAAVSVCGVAMGALNYRRGRSTMFFDLAVRNRPSAKFSVALWAFLAAMLFGITTVLPGEKFDLLGPSSEKLYFLRYLYIFVALPIAYCCTFMFCVGLAALAMTRSASQRG